MKNLFAAIFFFAFILLLSGGCHKSQDGPWSGSYLNALGGGADSLALLSVSYAGSHSINITFQISEQGYLYTALTLQNVPITGDSAIIDQDQHIIEATDLGPFRFAGGATISGTLLTLNATASDLTTGHSSDTKVFQFSGHRVQ
jgi:hypothetical protein